MRRCRFLDSEFQGEMLAVISKYHKFVETSRCLCVFLSETGLPLLGLISTALRSGTPIPQITPCPLLNRFLRYNHGLNVVLEEEDEEFELPKTTTVDVLKDDQYMYVSSLPTIEPLWVLTSLPRFFCVGVSTACSLVNNLDKLMVATKELVGEQYHIHGIGIAQKGGYEPPPTPGLVYPDPSKQV